MCKDSGYYSNIPHLLSPEILQNPLLHTKERSYCAHKEGEKTATCIFQDHGCVPTFCPHALADYDVFSCATRVAGAKVVWPCVRMRYCLMS